VFGKNEYAYEVIPYYDGKRKQIRQHVKYLGKVTGEGIRRVRGVVVERPVVVVDFGSVSKTELVQFPVGEPVSGKTGEG